LMRADFCCIPGWKRTYYTAFSLGGSRDGVQIVPETCVGDIIQNGDPAALDEGEQLSQGKAIASRYQPSSSVLSGNADALPEQVVRLRGDAPMLFAVGVHGQNLFVDRQNEIVSRNSCHRRCRWTARGLSSRWRQSERLGGTCLG
jgi:hypothetical protein